MRGFLLLEMGLRNLVSLEYDGWVEGLEGLWDGTG